MSHQETQSSVRPVVVPDAQVTQDIGYKPTRTVGPGWATSAGVLFMVAGFWNFFAGWAALVRKEYFSEASLLYHDLQVVGWVWLGLGVIQVLASYLIFGPPGERSGTGHRVGGPVDARVVLHHRRLPDVGHDDRGARRLHHLWLDRTRRSLPVGRSIDLSSPTLAGRGRRVPLSEQVVERALGFLRFGQEIVDRLSRSFLRSLQHVVERRPLEISGSGHEIVEAPTRVALQADPERRQNRGVRLREPRRHLDLRPGFLRRAPGVVRHPFAGRRPSCSSPSRSLVRSTRLLALATYPEPGER